MVDSLTRTDLKSRTSRRYKSRLAKLEKDVCWNRTQDTNVYVHNALQAHMDEQAALNRQATGSNPVGSTEESTGLGRLDAATANLNDAGHACLFFSIEGGYMSRFEQKLAEKYVTTRFAAEHRERSLALCDYCDVSWYVTKDKLVGSEDEITARTICPTCGRRVRVYVPTIRNRIMAYFSTTDQIIVTLSILFIALVYSMAFFVAVSYDWVGLAVYFMLICLSTILFIHIETDLGELPKTDDGKVDYDFIRHILDGGTE